MLPPAALIASSADLENLLAQTVKLRSNFPFPNILTPPFFSFETNPASIKRVGVTFVPS